MSSPKRCCEIFPKPCCCPPPCPPPPPRRCRAYAGGIIYRPGGPEDWPFTASWEEVQWAVECAEGDIIVYFDNQYQNPIVLDQKISGGVDALLLDGRFRVTFASAVNGQEFSLSSGGSPPSTWWPMTVRSAAVAEAPREFKDRQVQGVVVASKKGQDKKEEEKSHHSQSRSLLLPPATSPATSLQTLFEQWKKQHGKQSKAATKIDVKRLAKPKHRLVPSKPAPLASVTFPRLSTLPYQRAQAQALWGKGGDKKTETTTTTKDKSISSSTTRAVSRFTTSPTGPPIQSLDIEIRDGAYFQNIRQLSGPIQFTCFCTSTSSFQWTRANGVFILNPGSGINLGSGSTLPAVLPLPSSAFTLLAEVGSGFDNSLATSVPVLQLSDAAILICAVALFSNFSQDSIGDDGTCFAAYNSDSSSGIWNNLGSWTGTVFQGLFDRAAVLAYDDFLVPPQLVPSPAPYGATVQQAIDALKFMTSGLVPVLQTYTPQLTDSSGNAFQTASVSGSYYLIGKIYMVTMQLYIIGNAGVTLSDAVRLTLPATIGPTTMARASATIGFAKGLALGSATYPTCHGDAGNNWLWFDAWDQTGSNIPSLCSSVSPGAEFQIAVTFWVD